VGRDDTYVVTVMSIVLTCHVGYNISDEIYLHFFCCFNGNGTNGFICICHIYLVSRDSFTSLFDSQYRVLLATGCTYKTRQDAWRAGKPRIATVRLAVQPGDHVNVAHGGATDAFRRLSHLLYCVGIRLHPNPNITPSAAMLRRILFRSSNEIP